MHHSNFIRSICCSSLSKWPSLDIWLLDNAVCKEKLCEARLWLHWPESPWFSRESKAAITVNRLKKRSMGRNMPSGSFWHFADPPFCGLAWVTWVSIFCLSTENGANYAGRVKALAVLAACRAVPELPTCLLYWSESNRSPANKQQSAHQNHGNDSIIIIFPTASASDLPLQPRSWWSVVWGPWSSVPNQLPQDREMVLNQGDV